MGLSFEQPFLHRATLNPNKITEKVGKREAFIRKTPYVIIQESSIEQRQNIFHCADFFLREILCTRTIENFFLNQVT
jgi:hypothetical protein